MKRRSFFRWVLICVATALCLALAALWAVSGRYWVFFSIGRTLTCYIDRGVVTIENMRDAVGFACDENQGTSLPRFTRGDGWQRISKSWRGPMIDVVAVALVATALLWLWPTRWRRGPGTCRECGYNLTGNVAGRCPECGTACEVAGTVSPPKATGSP